MIAKAEAVSMSEAVAPPPQPRVEPHGAADEGQHTDAVDERERVAGGDWPHGRPLESVRQRQNGHAERDEKDGARRPERPGAAAVRCVIGSSHVLGAGGGSAPDARLSGKAINTSVRETPTIPSPLSGAVVHFNPSFFPAESKSIDSRIRLARVSGRLAV